MTVRNHLQEQLQRIAQDRAKQDSVNAVLEINPDAVILAAELDGISPDKRGALHGLTVLLKDNISTADKTHTSAGSLALADHYAAEDAHIVKRLRASGALILGKANMTEFANFISLDMPPGYSARGGYVRNPHNPAESPSGSSSGSAAAAATQLCDASIGTETSGSIISACQYCGVAGIKPTLGLVSRTGIIPISFTLDTAGPIAPDVKTAAMLLQAIAGYDPADAAAESVKGREITDYSRALDAHSLRGARIGVNRGIDPSRDYEPFSEKFLQFLKGQGSELIELEPIPMPVQILDIMNCEFKAAMGNYLATAGRKAAPRSLADIAAFNLSHAETALRFGQGRLEFALNEASGRMTEPAYLEALDGRRKLIEKLDNIYRSLRLDAVVEAAGWNAVAPFTGFPAGTVPIGRYDNNVPVGCYLMCRPFEDDKLLSLLYAVEQNISGA